MRRMLTVGALFVATATAPAMGRDDDGDIRAAVKKALPLLQRSAATFVEKRACGSCHHNGLTAMAVDLARKRGFQVDEDLASDQWDGLKSFMEISISEEKLARMRAGKGGPSGAFDYGYAALTYASRDGKPTASTEAGNEYLLAVQREDGAWPDIIKRPPLTGGETAATAVAVYSLRQYPTGHRTAEVERSIAKAREWLVKADPGNATDRGYQLLGLGWANASEGETKGVVAKLLAEQREDGGWSQLPDRASDSFATGLVLVALHQAGGVPTADPTYRKGVKFLLRTQKEDGSWLVETRVTETVNTYFESGFPHGKHQWISICGASWATMALTLTVDPGR